MGNLRLPCSSSNSLRSGPSTCASSGRDTPRSTTPTPNWRKRERRGDRTRKPLGKRHALPGSAPTLRRRDRRASVASAWAVARAVGRTAVALSLGRRKLHPDLASTDDEQRSVAPGCRISTRLRGGRRRCGERPCLSEWERRQEPIRGNEVDGHLARAWLFGELNTDDYADRTRISGEIERLSRQIPQAKQRMDGIGRTIDDLKAEGLHQLFRRHRAELDAGRNLLDEMAAKLDVRIAYAQWEGSPPRNPPAPATRDARDLPERGLADLERWRARQGHAPPVASAKVTASQGSAGETDSELSPEQWSKLRPVLDRLFLAVRRELKPGQDLFREFVGKIKKTLLGQVGLPKKTVTAAVKRWNRETRGGRDLNRRRDGR